MKHTTNGFYEALKKPIDNGPTYARPRIRQAKLKGGFGDIVIKRPAVGNWACDSCKEKGEGAKAMFVHSSLTNHFKFTGDKGGTETL